MNNYLQRFLLEDLDIRGAIVRLDSVWQQIQSGRDYPAPVTQILGEMTATTLLFGSNLKQAGRLTVQLSGNGSISMLIIDCNENLHIRGMAKCEGVIEQKPLPELLGNGQLVLSLDMDSMREAHQSIVPLTGNNVTEVFEHYLEQSEQLHSRLFLAASTEAAVGIFLQKLPTADQRDEDGWTRIETLASTVSDTELLTLQSETLLTRLFHEETVRVFEAQPVHYGCKENPEKIHSMLRSLGREEVDSILQEFGEIIINDDICNREYRFDALAVDAIFSKISPTIH
ncbi:MAG: Hsp33 family molecular chaperone HslO [Nitrosomonas sp.]|nr:Hsp33 family molecular chaperone HslO [Nitrosomonas sp.]